LRPRSRIPDAERDLLVAERTKLAMEIANIATEIAASGDIPAFARGEMAHMRLNGSLKQGQEGL
jgi:hypothetical protein